MSATGRPEREYRSAQREGTPMQLVPLIRAGLDTLNFGFAIFDGDCGSSRATRRSAPSVVIPLRCASPASGSSTSTGTTRSAGTTAPATLNRR